MYKKYEQNKKLFCQDLDIEFDKIYRANNYLLKIEKVRNGWQKIDKKFSTIVNNLGLEISDKYICYISLYGPEGKFSYPNIIDLRINNHKDIISANETIAHEILHLMIYKYVSELKLNYQEIEGVVDLLITETELGNIFPKYKPQSISIYNKKIVHEFTKVIK